MHGQVSGPEEGGSQRGDRELWTVKPGEHAFWLYVVYAVALAGGAVETTDVAKPNWRSCARRAQCSASRAFHGRKGVCGETAECRRA